jgi:hypothetical protein
MAVRWYQVLWAALMFLNDVRSANKVLGGNSGPEIYDESRMRPSNSVERGETLRVLPHIL